MFEQEGHTLFPLHTSCCFFFFLCDVSAVFKNHERRSTLSKGCEEIPPCGFDVRFSNEK